MAAAALEGIASKDHADHALDDVEGACVEAHLGPC